MTNAPATENLRFMCPVLSCGTILSVPAKVRGELVVCQQCGTIIRVPIARNTSAKPADAAPKS